MQQGQRCRALQWDYGAALADAGLTDKPADPEPHGNVRKTIHLEAAKSVKRVGLEFISGEAPQMRLSRRSVVLALAALGVGGAVVAMQPRWLYISPGVAGAEVLSAPDAYRALQEGRIVLVDIRRPDEWEASGSAQGAHRLDMRSDDFIDALGAVAAQDKSAPIALICARGVRSARLARRLTEAGFTRIIDVPEGMLGSSAGPGWIARGLPIEEVG